jgi:hypothetical protein
VKTETRNISDSLLKLKPAAELKRVVEQFKTTSVEVEADSNLLQYITTNVVNGTLEISVNESIDSAGRNL